MSSESLTVIRMPVIRIVQVSTDGVLWIDLFQLFKTRILYNQLGMPQKEGAG